MPEPRWDGLQGRIAPGSRMIDGLYRVETRYLCAGFVVEDGRVTMCAPILRRKLAYWQTVAVRVG
jgi:hypothetical protein